MNTALPLMLPDWPAPQGVQACVTTRTGGVSMPPYDTFNLGLHVGDAIHAVTENRARLCALLPAEPCWLEQVHGIAVARGDVAYQERICADAITTREQGVVCTVMTADCLPVLFCNDAGSVVGAAHAGWRGLVAGVLEQTVAHMEEDPAQVMAWMGPAIGPQAFEVGEEVREAFVAVHPIAGDAFVPAGEGKWLADLFMLARIRLQAAGVERVYGGGVCTHTESARFYSYRRDRVTGRFASLIWLG